MDDPVVTHELDEITDDFKGHEKLPFAKQVEAIWPERRSSYVFLMSVIVMFWQQVTFSLRCRRTRVLTCTQFTGTNPLNYYAPQIFQSIGLDGQQSSLFATGIYGVVKIVVTALGLMLATEQVGRKWSLIVGGLGQAFAMLYIGINQAVHPSNANAPLDGNSTFAIVCVYLFVVFYGFGWGPIPFVFSAKCSVCH